MNTPNLPTHGIQRLILDRKGDRSMEALSKACGGNPTRANLQRLVSEPVKSFPKDMEVIRGLAKGLGVRSIDVVSAFAASLGLPVGGNETDLVIPNAGLLPDASQNVLRNVASNMLSLQEQASAPARQIERRDSWALAADYDASTGDSEPLPDTP